MEMKFCFEPYRRTSKEEIKNTATVSSKFGRLSFPKLTIEHLGLGGKFIRIYFDSQKKAIGWKVFDEGKLKDLEGFKKVTLKKTGCAVFDIVGIIKNFKLKQDSYKHLEIKKYNEGGLLGNEYYYVKIDE
jgi:hypothetical protein